MCFFTKILKLDFVAIKPRQCKKHNCDIEVAQWFKGFVRSVNQPILTILRICGDFKIRFDNNLFPNPLFFFITGLDLSLLNFHLPEIITDRDL